MRTVLKHTTELGQLHSILDVDMQHTPGAQYVDKNGAHYEYGYNGTGAACEQNRPCYQTWSTDGINPFYYKIATGDDEYCLIGIPQANIPSTYWGWFHWKGPTTNRMYYDCVDHNLTQSITDGQGLAVTAAQVVSATLALTDQKDFAVATETRASQLNGHVWLFGRRCLTASS
jgi:hypothetical protein